MLAGLEEMQYLQGSLEVITLYMHNVEKWTNLLQNFKSTFGYCSTLYTKRIKQLLKPYKNKFHHEAQLFCDNNYEYYFFLCLLIALVEISRLINEDVRK